MEIDIVKQEKNYLEFVIIGERYTLPSLLKSRLLSDSNVVFVSNRLEHLMRNKTHFVLRTKNNSPKKSLEEALKKTEKDLTAFELGIKKALK